jgi:ABC-type polysaccharide/polyol phosphate export permease
MQAVAHVNPVTYTIEAMRVLLNGPASASNHNVGLVILEALGILLGLGTVTMTLATRRFRGIVS